MRFLGRRLHGKGYCGCFDCARPLDRQERRRIKRRQRQAAKRDIRNDRLEVTG